MIYSVPLKRVKNSRKRSTNSSVSLRSTSRRLQMVSTSTTKPGRKSRMRLMTSRKSSRNSRRPTGPRTTTQPSTISVTPKRHKTLVIAQNTSKSPMKDRLSTRSSRILTKPLRSTLKFLTSQRSGRKICSSSENPKVILINENIL